MSNFDDLNEQAMAKTMGPLTGLVGYQGFMWHTEAAQ